MRWKVTVEGGRDGLQLGRSTTSARCRTLADVHASAGGKRSKQEQGSRLGSMSSGGAVWLVLLRIQRQSANDRRGAWWDFIHLNLGEPAGTSVLTSRTLLSDLSIDPLILAVAGNLTD